MEKNKNSIILHFILEYSTPGWFSITSSGSTGRTVANVLGLYEIVNATYNQHPIYKMVGDGYFLFYSDTKHWMVGSKVGSSVGYIRTVSTGDMESPLTGWSFFNGNEWVLDQDLMVEPYNG